MSSSLSFPHPLDNFVVSFNEISLEKSNNSMKQARLKKINKITKKQLTQRTVPNYPRPKLQTSVAILESSSVPPSITKSHRESKKSLSLTSVKEPLSLALIPAEDWKNPLDKTSWF